MKVIISITKTDIGFILFALVLLGIAVNSQVKRNNLKENASYTIGTTTKKSYGRWATYIKYEYSTNGKEYASSHLIKNKEIRKGEKYYVIFQADKPENSRLLTNEPVKYIPNPIPINGWKELPKTKNTSILNDEIQNKLMDLNRTIPGTTRVKGRKFAYIEHSSKSSFSDFFDKIGSAGSIAMPKFGGCINENTMIELPNKKQMFGISYKGDIVAWKKMLSKTCQVNNLELGEIEGQSIKLSNGNIILLSDCDVHFY
ncbi:MAG: hypothetical protein JEZ01_08900 [Labilibaculum sp.]|nr:hypothetical protein [Labilibaculum sp.]MBI9057880.1 hypothetical protein [Labilibaculum sp.]